jgi:hypothetical protein
MKYAQRDKQGAIVAVYGRPQPGLRLEAMAEDDAALVAYLTRPLERPRISPAELAKALDQIAQASNISSADRTRLDALLGQLGVST